MACALESKHDVRSIRLRLPFRFGVITLREVALLHLAVPGYGVAVDPDLASMTPRPARRVEMLAAGA